MIRYLWLLECDWFGPEIPEPGFSKLKCALSTRVRSDGGLAVRPRALWNHDCEVSRR